jgi:hypothetical protein
MGKYVQEHSQEPPPQFGILDYVIAVAVARYAGLVSVMSSEREQRAEPVSEPDQLFRKSPQTREDLHAQHPGHEHRRIHAGRSYSEHGPRN